MSPKPLRRWYQFGLSTLLIGLTLFSLPLGYIAWEREQCRRGQQAIEILGHSLGQLRPEDFGEVGRRINPSGRPGWLKFILGDDQFREYEFIELGGESVSDSDLRHLAAFPNLHGVLLGVTNVTDEGVEHLRGLK